MRTIPFALSAKGVPFCDYANVALALDNQGYWWDELQGQAMTADNHVADASHRHEVVCDLAADYDLRGVRKEWVKECIDYFAMKDRRHPIRLYLDSLVWDGKPRLDDFAYNGLCGPGANDEEDDYNAVRVRLYLLQMVARVRKPGCPAHMMLVFYAQAGGEKKSSGIETLCTSAWVNDTPIPADEKRAIITLPKFWVHEMQEMPTARDAKEYTAFVSSATCKGNRMYGVDFENIQRAFVLFGTTNDRQCLVDTGTNNRRFPVVTVTGADLHYIQRYRDQIFAEADARYKAGEQYWMTPAEEAETGRRNQVATVRDDALLDILTDVITGRMSRSAWRLGDLIHALADDTPTLRVTQKALCAALRMLGWAPDPTKNERMWVFNPPAGCANPCPPKKLTNTKRINL